MSNHEHHDEQDVPHPEEMASSEQEEHGSNDHGQEAPPAHEVVTTGKKDVAHRRHHAQMHRELRAWNGMGPMAQANFRHINH